MIAVPRVELSAGPIDYLDTGGDGPVLVMTHGLPMNAAQWRKVVPLLDGYRCIRPTLPMGAHRTAMRADADLSQRGQALLVAEFLDALDLHDVTLVLNDWGGAQFVVSERRDDRVARLVLVACEAFDNFPPGAAKGLAKAMRIPGMPWLNFQAHRLGAVRRMPVGYGGMSLRGVPDDVLDQWFTPARVDKAVRRDFVKFATTTPDREILLAWFARMRAFDRPVLIVWAANDRFMPAEHGPRLAELYPNSRLVVIDDSATLVPEDQPEQLADAMRAFLVETDAVLG